MLAYGQTGTGKTHTVFGPKEAQLDVGAYDEWGVFPKVVSNTLKVMNEKGLKFKLFISSLEFYLYQAYDLLNKNAPVTIARETGPRNATQILIEKIEDL